MLIQIETPHFLSATIEIRDGLETLCVRTDLSLRDDVNGRLRPETERFIDQALAARDARYPYIKRVDFIRRAA